MGLREAQPDCHIGLRAVAEEEEQDDPPLPVVEPARGAGDGRPVEQHVVESRVR